MCTNDQKENLDALNHFVGYGNPKAKFWFMGIEEGGSDINENDIKKYRDCYSPKNVCFNIINEVAECNYSPYINFIFKLVTSFSPQTDTTPAHVGTKNFNSYNFNLLPLACQDNHSAYSKKYIEYFGIDSRKTFTSKKFNHLTTRVDVVGEYLKGFLYENPSADQNKYLFCMGKKHWEDYMLLLNKIFGCTIDNFTKEKVGRKHAMYYTKNNFTIILTYHPSHSWITAEQAIKLISSIEYMNK